MPRAPCRVVSGGTKTKSRELSKSDFGPTGRSASSIFKGNPLGSRGTAELSPTAPRIDRVPAAALAMAGAIRNTTGQNHPRTLICHEQSVMLRR